MTIQQRKQIKKKIIKDIEFLKNEMTELKKKTKPIAPDCSLGRLTRMEMIGEQKVNEYALQEARIRLHKLEYTLRKVDEETYGICIECDEEIPLERLLILPESVRCIECESNQ